MQVTGRIVVCPQRTEVLMGYGIWGGIPEQPLLSGPVLHPMDLPFIRFPRHQLLKKLSLDYPLLSETNNHLHYIAGVLPD